MPVPVVPAALPLKAPFPYFGGKSRAAHLIWARFGAPDHYIEPFAGSLAVLLARPADQLPAVETVNDLDGYITNFWRAVKHDPEAVAHWADWPVSELDLHARHYWLLTTGKPDVDRLAGDPDHYDAKVAGWWVWGACAWIGSGWCSGRGPWRTVDGRLTRMPEGAQGINRQLPHVSGGRGINRQLPHVSGGQGINRKLPHVSGGQGINRQLPHVSGGQGINRQRFIADWLTNLSERLRDVRVVCGDWQRAVRSNSVLFPVRGGVTAVLLDPPYATPHAADYNEQADGLADAVRAWCLAHGNNPRLRLALCGYSGEHEALEHQGWQCVAWAQRKGYQRAGADGAHSGHLERIWFSPHCLMPAHVADAPVDLFAEVF